MIYVEYQQKTMKLLQEVSLEYKELFQCLHLNHLVRRSEWATTLEFCGHMDQPTITLRFIDQGTSPVNLDWRASN